MGLKDPLDGYGYAVDGRRDWPDNNYDLGDDIKTFVTKLFRSSASLPRQIEDVGNPENGQMSTD